MTRSIARVIEVYHNKVMSMSALPMVSLMLQRVATKVSTSCYHRMIRVLFFIQYFRVYDPVFLQEGIQVGYKKAP